MNKRIIYLVSTKNLAQQNIYKVGKTEFNQNTPEDSIKINRLASAQAFNIEKLIIYGYEVFENEFKPYIIDIDKDFHKFLNENNIQHFECDGGTEFFKFNNKEEFYKLINQYKNSYNPKDDCIKEYKEYDKEIDGTKRQIPPGLREKIIDKINKKDITPYTTFCYMAAADYQTIEILVKDIKKHLRKNGYFKNENNNTINNYIYNNMLYIVCINKQEYNIILKNNSKIKNIELYIKNIEDYEVSKKFDYILINPPYATKGANNIHLDFVKKCIEISNNVICIMPNSLFYRNSSSFKKYIEIFNDNLYYIEEIDSKLFINTNMQNPAIYCFNNINNEGVNIKYLNNKEEFIYGGIQNKDFSGFNDYEKEIVKYLYTDNTNYSIYCPRDKNNLKKYIENNILKKFEYNKIFLLTNLSNGSSKGPWNPHFISSKLGQILNNKNELEKELYNRKGAGCIIMTFNSIKSTENCKNSLNRNLLRFTLLRTQTNQNLHSYHYQYIPNINWEDDRVKTDEGLLEVCGCPKEKIQEYIEYVNNIMKDYPL